MERLTTRVYGMGAVLLGLGALMSFSAGIKPGQAKTEKWMEEKAPRRIGNFTFIPGTDNPQQTYKMDKRTYETLAPYGIVCRTYSYGGQSFDVVVIASRSRGSFHDPRVCFGAQGWTLVTQDVVDVPTKSRGKVPVTIAHMDGQTRDQIAAFFYRSPTGFVASTNGVKIQMFLQQLKGETNLDGVFYRVIPTYPKATQDEIVKFIGAYLDAANESSGGFF